MPPSRRKKGNPRVARLVKRLGDGRATATHECELLLLHLVHAFASGVSGAAAESAAEKAEYGGDEANWGVEEGDIRRALARLSGTALPNPRMVELHGAFIAGGSSSGDGPTRSRKAPAAAKKPHRYRPGSQQIAGIRRYQKPSPKKAAAAPSSTSPSSAVAAASAAVARAHMLVSGAAPLPKALRRPAGLGLGGPPT